jgi:hypothetical protein
MFPPTLYIAITNHGFGHAVRAACVAAQIRQICPECVLILVTTAPRWLLESYIPGDFILRPRGFDVGVIQSDSLTMDKAATLEKLKEIRQKQQSIIASEVNFIQQNRVDVILADIPPIAAQIAKAAGIPGLMMGNFGWDFIYRDWGEEFIEMADWIEDCFSQCDRLFRLPLHESMSAFPNITDVGLTGGNPRYDLEQLRVDFEIKTLPEKTILLTFGGLSLAKIPYDNLAKLSDFTFITFDKKAPNLPNLVRVKHQIQQKQSEIDYSHIRPVDFMPLCGRVVSKPGFSTYAEALRLEIPIISLSRKGFAEAPILEASLKNYSPHQIISPADFYEGNWEFIKQPMNPPILSKKLDKTGNETIARAVVNWLQSE